MRSSNKSHNRTRHGAKWECSPEAANHGTIRINFARHKGEIYASTRIFARTVKDIRLSEGSSTVTCGVQSDIQQMIGFSSAAMALIQFASNISDTMARRPGVHRQTTTTKNCVASCDEIANERSEVRVVFRTVKSTNPIQQDNLLLLRSLVHLML